MSINLGQRWRHLLQRARDFRATAQAQETLPEKLAAAHDKPSASASSPSGDGPSGLQDQTASSTPDSGSSIYRRTPDPRFGSQSAAQRQAWEALQHAKEEEAEEAAIEHSRQRQQHEAAHKQQAR